MDPIYEARKQVLAQESIRPLADQWSLYWEDGHWWYQDYLTLLAREHDEDAAMDAYLGQLRAGSDDASRALQQWSGVLIDRVKWHSRLQVTLYDKLQSYVSQPRHTAPQELHDHHALVKMHIHACDVQQWMIGLTYLEHRRRTRPLKRGEWQKVWTRVRAAIEEQKRAQWALYRSHLADSTVRQRNDWLRRIVRLQEGTQQLLPPSWWRDRIGLWLQTNLVRWDIGGPGSLFEVRANRQIAGGLAGAVALVCALTFLAQLAGRTWSVQSAPPAPEPAAPTEVLVTPTPLPAATSVPEPTVAPPAPSGAPPGVSAGAWGRNREGIEQLRRGDCAAAIESFNAALAEQPDWAEPLSNRAFCHYERGELELARATWQRAVDLNPRSADAHAGYALALAASGDPAGAQAHYAEATRIDPGYRDPEWMRRERFWSERAIEDSAPLRSP